MFQHENFDVYEYEDIPLNNDGYLMDAKYIHEYEQAFLDFFNGGEYKNVGYISYIAVRSIGEHSLELSWYPNIYDRFHEVIVTLPRDKVITCVGCWRSDEKFHIFVNSEWLEQLHLRHYSVFGMVDAIGVKNAIREGALSKDRLAGLRDAIDNLSGAYSQVSFISFADSLLLKSNWTAGYFEKGVKYTYKPEIFLHIFSALKSIYRQHLNLEIYGILTQGSNEYYDDNLLHISTSQNHICLNSLGAPFADLLTIDETARRCIKEKVHSPHDLYMDAQFYHSLNLKFEFDKKAVGKQAYVATMKTKESHYYYNDCQIILDNLDKNKI